MDFSMVGPALVLGLGCVGSSIGCGISGMASHAVMSRVEENHGKFIGMSAVSSSQAIFGFVLMLLMKNSIEAGTLTPLSGIGIGFSVGLALLFSSIYQGNALRQGFKPQQSNLQSSANVSPPLALSSPFPFLLLSLHCF